MTYEHYSPEWLAAHCDHGSAFERAVHKALTSLLAENKQLRAALEQPQVEQEPVAVAKIIGMDEFGPMLLWHRAWTDFPVGTKLYTHPQPPRQPLTDDEINTIWRNSTHMTIVEVVRAIEAAHGIKEQK